MVMHGQSLVGNLYTFVRPRFPQHTSNTLDFHCNLFHSFAITKSLQIVVRQVTPQMPVFNGYAWAVLLPLTCPPLSNRNTSCVCCSGAPSSVVLPSFSTHFLAVASSSETSLLGVPYGGSTLVPVRAFVLLIDVPRVSTAHEAAGRCS